MVFLLRGFYDTVCFYGGVRCGMVFSVGCVRYCRAIYSCDGTAGDVCLVVGWLLLWLSGHLWSPSLSPRQILHRIVSYLILSYPILKFIVSL